MPPVTDTAHVPHPHVESVPLTVQLNGAPQLLDAPTLAAALAVLELPTDAGHIAIAVNESVVARAKWDAVTLRTNDRIEVITAVAGG